MDIHGLLEMVINSPLLTGLCTATVVALAAGDEINGNLTRIMSQLREIDARLIRTEGKVDTLIGRSSEDRGRIKINEDNIGGLFVRTARIEDRQRGLTAAQGVFATVAAAIAAFIGLQR